MQLFRKNQTAVKSVGLCAVCNGRSGPLSGIPDEAFSSGMLGVGYAIEPQEGLFCAPADGKIQSIAQTKHAYSLYTDSGLDLLIHIGVDTVTLQGQGFEALVSEGQQVHAGEPIARADLSLIQARELPTVTAVLVTEPEKISNLEFQFGEAIGGKTSVMRFTVL